MLSKKVSVVICVAVAMCLVSSVMAVDISGPTTGDINVGNLEVVNFLPGASTLGYINVSSGGEVNLFAGTFVSVFEHDFSYTDWYELSATGGTVKVHGTQFSVGGTAIPQDTPHITLSDYPAGAYGYYNVEWTDAAVPAGNSYDIWMSADVPVNLIWLGTEPENQAPVADAGGPYTGGSADGGPVAVDLTAAASADSDGTITEWNWDLDNDGVYETNAMIVNINSFPVGTSTVGLVVVDNLGLESAPVTTTVTVEQLTPEIEVYPVELAHDYGDTEVGISETYIVQIVNTGQGNLNVSSISLAGSGDFTITDSPAPVNGIIVITPNEIASIDIEITYTPSAEGYTTATLTIVSDDADESAVDVILSGVGVIIEVPIQNQIQEIIDFYNASVADGTILGYAPHANAKTAANRVKALGNMLKAAGSLIEIGELETAIKQLGDIAKKTDGENRPPDFVIGGSVPTLNQMVDDIITSMSS